MKRRVVVTSMGFITPMGSDPDTVMASFMQNRTVFGRASYDRALCVAEVSEFNLKAHVGPCKNARYLNRGAAFAVASAVKAVKQSGLVPDMLAGAGLFCGVGPNMDLGNEMGTIQDGEIRTKGLRALWLLRFLPNTAASVIAGLTGIHGENLTISNACATALQAIGEAFRRIRDGHLDVALAGGGDSRINPGAAMAYRMAGALNAGGEDPGRCMRPFDRSRMGFSSGEGGGFFVLEELGHAQRRGASIWCEIRGYGASLDAGSMTAPDPSGIWTEKAMTRALDQAEMEVSDVDVISAHGTATQRNDQMEASLFSRVFHGACPHIIALKSWFGHLSAACGAAELAMVLTLMKHGVLPPIRNLEEPVADLNFVRAFVRTDVQHVLLENFGFGGQNAALVVKRWQ